MFKFVADKPYPWPVKVQVPRQDQPGEFDTQVFHARFITLTADRTGELLGGGEAAAVRDPGLLLGLAQQLDFGALLKEAIVGWEEDLVDANDQPVPFSANNLDAILNWLPARNALLAAYVESVSPAGRAAAKRKN